jgi:hypothetical protein
MLHTEMNDQQVEQQRSTPSTVGRDAPTGELTDKQISCSGRFGQLW